MIRIKPIMLRHFEVSPLGRSWKRCSHMGVNPKMVGFPNKTMGFPTKNDHHLGWRLGVPPFKETPICSHLESR